jgi:ABC-2 type transport system permease protein
MTRVFIRLRLRLLRNGLRSTQGRLGFIMVCVFAALVAVGGLVSFGVAGGLNPVDQERTVIGGLTVFFVAWVFSPLLTGGVDESVDPGRLALLPLTRSELRRGLVAAALVSVLPLGGAIALMGLVISFGRGWALPIVTACALVMMAMSVVSSRTLATALAGALRSRRGRDLAVAGSALLGAGLWLGSQLLGSLKSSQFDAAVRVLRWFPPGWLGQAILDADREHYLPALARLAAGLAFTAMAARRWMAGIDRLITDPGPTMGSRERASSGRPLLGRLGSILPSGPAGAVIAKELRYQFRSPARRSMSITGLVTGVMLTVLQVIRQPGSHPSAIWLAPAAGAFMGLQSFNLLGHDGRSLWMETLAAPPGRIRLLGRSVSWALSTLAPTVVALVVLGLTSGFRSAPAVLGCGVAFMFLIAAVAAPTSVVMPIPIPDDANPFRRQAPEGQGCLAGLRALVAMFVLGVMAAPVAIGMLLLNDGRGPAQFALVVASLAYAIGAWWIGLGIGARMLADREPEVLTLVAGRAS